MSGRTRLAGHGHRAPKAPRGDDSLRAVKGRGADPRALARGWLLPSAGGGNAGGALLDRDPAAERHRCTPHGACAERHGPGRPDADQPDARPQHALGAGHRPRRDRDPGRGREGASQRGNLAARARSRGIRRPRLEVAAAVRLDDHRAAQAAGRLMRLRARAIHARRGLRARRLPRLRAPLRQGLHLPRQLHGQLGRWLALGDLRPRGREPRGRGHPVLDRLSGRGVRPRADGGDGAPRDDARRYRGGGASRRRALQGPDRR